MKNQYTADINDYRKYGLIRALTSSLDIKVGVFWMLTPDDGGNDGGRTGYLEDPEQWRSYDPRLFEKLHEIVHLHKNRNVSLIQDANIIPGAVYVEDFVSDNSRERNFLFLSSMKRLRDCSLIFFDPDNGLEVKSRPLGRKGSSKYLYLDEIGKAFRSGHSLLIYQHYPFEEREQYRHERARQLAFTCMTNIIYSFSTAHVCFFLVPQQGQMTYFQKQTKVVDSQWGGQIQTFIHEINNSQETSPVIKYEPWMGKEFRSILIEKAVKEAVQELTNEGFPVGTMGSCHAIWPRQKRILKQKYNIDWKSPAEEYPQCFFD